MTGFRPFRNSDPPALAEIWRSQPPQRGLAQPVTAAILDRFVFSKPYFDRHGLIIAEENDGPVGFVHAGFGASDAADRLSFDMGVISMLLVRPHPQRDEIARQLVARGEEYLRGRGAKLLYAGGIRPLNPFYLGLYGGSELPGILASDEAALALFKSCGYEEIDRCLIHQRELAGFRPPVDRQQMQARRQWKLEAVFDPPAENWWDACLYALADRTRFQLVPRDGGPAAGLATYWEMEPLATGWGVRAVGLVDLEIAADHRRQGLATFLVSESLRQLQSHGVALVEVQTMQQNTAAKALYQKLGFQQIDQGIVLRKSAQTANDQ